MLAVHGKNSFASWAERLCKMSNDLVKEPVWSDVCNLFDIEKVERTHSNLSNPLFPALSRLERYLAKDAEPSTEILPLANRFFNFFEKADLVTEAKRYLFNLYNEDYNKFAQKMMLLVQMVISEYSEYYY